MPANELTLHGTCATCGRAIHRNAGAAWTHDRRPSLTSGPLPAPTPRATVDATATAPGNVRPLPGAGVTEHRHTLETADRMKVAAVGTVSRWKAYRWRCTCGYVTNWSRDERRAARHRDAHAFDGQRSMTFAGADVVEVGADATDASPQRAGALRATEPRDPSPAPLGRARRRGKTSADR